MTGLPGFFLSLWLCNGAPSIARNQQHPYTGAATPNVGKYRQMSRGSLVTSPLKTALAIWFTCHITSWMKESCNLSKQLGRRSFGSCETIPGKTQSCFFCFCREQAQKVLRAKSYFIKLIKYSVLRQLKFYDEKVILLL